MISLTEKLRRASNMEENEQLSALLMDAARTIEEYEEEDRAADKRMEDSDWARQYREACIKIAEQHDELEKLRASTATPTAPSAKRTE